ncbi:MAG: hypothetical protein GF353_27195 [Candidatus Lokiarchaeota archaeon]|nr:hypothetical protein [Candidatus Lokiarchaeota archaeon]
MDVTSISAVIASTNTLLDIAKSIRSIAKQTELREYIIKFQDEITILQSRLLTTQQEQSQLIQIKNEIEKKLIKYENWENTKSQYELKQIASGVFVYSTKENKKTSEPMHWLCCNCFDVYHRKSILQFYGVAWGGNDNYYGCTECKNKIRIPKDIKP